MKPSSPYFLRWEVLDDDFQRIKNSHNSAKKRKRKQLTNIVFSLVTVQRKKEKTNKVSGTFDKTRARFDLAFYNNATVRQIQLTFFS